MKTLHFLIADRWPSNSTLAGRIAFPLLLLTAGLGVLQPCAGQSETWMATGSLATARNVHTATLLPDGKVLVAGGIGLGNHILASAELYDPATGTWTATGSLAIARDFHTATLLPNGKVLVAGGGGAGKSAELYDPTSGTWTATGRLTTAREGHTATLLPSGKVLVAGGIDNGLAFASAELYDPASGAWSTTGNLTIARAFHTATLLPDGKVLVAGNSNLGIPGSAELYDPATGTWTATGSPATPRQFHTATLLPNGKVLIAGGADVVALNSAELYDPTSGTWSMTGRLVTARRAHAASLLPNGKVLVAGGADTVGFSLASAELYDPASGAWSTTGSLATARSFYTATLLPNGNVLAAAGLGDGGANGALNSAELYTPGGTTCVSPPAGLVSWWAGDRTAEDVQGVNPGQLRNGATFAKGKVGPAFMFDGINDAVVIPNSPSLSQTRITLDAWVYPTGSQIGLNRHIISKDDEVVAREYVLGIEANTNRFNCLVQLPSGEVVVTGTTTAELNTWYHVAMTHDGLKLRLYVNGVLDGILDAVGDVVPTSNPVGIGGNILPTLFFQGIIDEVQIFNRALTDAEILGIYQAGADGQCKPEIFVDSITPSYKVSGHNYVISTSVVIQDVNGVGIQDADIRLAVILPTGSVLTFPLTTDATGAATTSFAASYTGLYQFKVQKVKHPTRDYNPALNIETSDTLVIP